MNFKVLGYRALVRPAEKKTKQGLLHLPDSAQEQDGTGEVLVVGRGVWTNTGAFVETELKVGDKVVYQPGHAQEVVIDGEKLHIVPEPNVLGVFGK